MSEHPAHARRRIVPDLAQVQIILGSLLGDGRVEGEPGARWLRISERADRAGYVWWKYGCLGALAGEPPATCDGVTSFRTIAHPFFDDVSTLINEPHGRLVELLDPIGRAVRNTDALGAGHAGVRETMSGEETDLIRE